MTKVLSFLVVLAAALGALHLNSVVRGDPSTLQSILDNDGIHAYFPGQPGYSNVSSSFNLRLPFEPAAVAYPTTAEEVAEAVQAGASLGIPGKHSCLCYLLFSSRRKDHSDRAFRGSLLRCIRSWWRGWSPGCRSQQLQRYIRRQRYWYRYYRRREPTWGHRDCPL